ncbi:DUF7577 domain-containing protein [Lysobacter xanthus]
MAAWRCPECGADNEDAFDLCYACGTGRDGAPADAGFRREDAPSPDPADRRLDCLRCHGPMRFTARRRLHDGSWAREALLGEWFVDRPAFDVYACPSCGKVELFLPDAAR